MKIIKLLEGFNRFIKKKLKNKLLEIVNMIRILIIMKSLKRDFCSLKQIKILFPLPCEKDIWQIIFNKLDFMDQRNMRQVSKYFMINFPITNLYDNVPNIHKLTDEVLKLFSYVIKLNVTSNRKITNVNHMKNLQILHAGDDCGINDHGIQQLVNLTELNVNNNSKITNVDHMKNLRILYAGYKCGIDDHGIQQLVNLTKLDVNSNSKITNVNHMKNLRSFLHPLLNILEYVNKC